MSSTTEQPGRWPVEEIPTDELAKRQGVESIVSVDELAQPGSVGIRAGVPRLPGRPLRHPASRHRVSTVVLDTDVASAVLRQRISITLARQFAGRPRPANDTWIAAGCLVRELPLATLNLKDFTDFAEHEGLQILPAQ